MTDLLKGHNKRSHNIVNSTHKLIADKVHLDWAITSFHHFFGITPGQKEECNPRRYAKELP
jgi:hypothetical protein